MAPCLLSVASSGKQLSALTGVCAHHWPTLRREGGREGRGGGGRASVTAFVCARVRMCIRAARLCELYSSYESHSVGGYNASAPSTTNVYRLTLFQVYNHIPYGVSFAHYDIGPPLALYFLFIFIFLRDEWSAWDSAIGVFY